MKHLVVLFILLQVSLQLYAQGENNIWAFGRYAGLDFSSGTAAYIYTQSFTGEGCATVCDAQGRLLFYTNGNQVWNSNHDMMPNGDSLLGNSGNWARQGSATQGVAIVPFIRDSGKYFIFTLDCAENINPPFTPGYLRYSVVDMSLDNGWGDVADNYKNIIVDSGMSEKMYVAQGANCYYWLVTHKYASDEFKCFRITDKVEGAVASHTSTITEFNKNSYMGGELKVSLDQKYAACAAVGNSKSNGIVELFNFNSRTGVVGNAVMLYETPPNIFIYGLSFSPDNSKLYFGLNAGIGDRPLPLYQLDLSLMPDIGAVRNSLTEVAQGTWSGMRIGPDNKVYLGAHNSNNIHRINKPNEKGLACDVELMPLPPLADSIYFMMGFGAYIFTKKDLFDAQSRSTDTFFCSQRLETLNLLAREGFENYLWSNGSRDNILTVHSPGVYTLLSSNDCGAVTDTFSVEEICQPCHYTATAFTPDFDGRNDYFKVLGSYKKLHQFIVYDRWGMEIFNIRENPNGWNGTFNGKPCDGGTYYYYYSVSCDNSNKIIGKKGDITLIR